jgi:MtN3 and saliva related transmembrane protein
MDTNTLGLIATALTTAAFIPQVVKIWRSRHTKDISLGMFAILSIGVFLWLLYGIRIDALPVILSNGITLVLSLTILVFKLRYK